MGVGGRKGQVPSWWVASSTLVRFDKLRSKADYAPFLHETTMSLCLASCLS